MDYSLLPPLPNGAKHISSLPIYAHLFGYAAMQDGTILTCKPSKTIKGISYLDFWREKHVYRTKVGYVILKTKTKGNRKCVTDKVHRIIGALFLDNPNHLPIINHKDGCKWNNVFSNLEWTTHKGNANHAIDNKMRDTACGERIPSSILTDKDIIHIFELKSIGFLNKEIASIFKLEISNISRILSRDKWKHVEIPQDLKDKVDEQLKTIKTQSRGIKLNEHDVIAIRERRKSGSRIKDISADYNINPNTCSQIIKGVYWKNVPI